MSEYQSQIISLFKEIYLFNQVEETRLGDLASRFEVVKLGPGELVFSQGDRRNYFYILLEGQVEVVRKVGNVESQMDCLIAGDFFGEEAFFSGKTRMASVRTLVPCVLLRLNEDGLFTMLEQYPQIETSLLRIIESHRFMRRHQFDWVGEDEVIYQLRRKHEAYLLIALIGPGLMAIVALLIGLIDVATGSTSTLSIGMIIVSGLLFSASLLWSGWAYIDWGNDYYIVTDQRVVWIERVVGLYESRVEAPLTAILSVDIKTSFLGRQLGYGNVVVRTFTGEVVFRGVTEPYEMAALVEEHWHRAQKSSRQSEQEEMEKSVRQAIGLDTEEDGQKRGNTPLGEASKPMDYAEPSLAQKYFANIFKMRFEVGQIITYRKHWIVLLRKTFLAMSAIFILVAGSFAYDTLFISGRFRAISPVLCNSVGILALFLVLFPWWLYNYVDWRNDIYQVTDKNIFDIERKPLGTESRKSASLENILSLEHKRPGFLGYVLNFGNVTISIGEDEFVFRDVHEPARIQQDIFSRMYTLRQQKEKAEVARERDRILTLMAAYHHNVERSDSAVDF
jgi:uncharacterized membrane protein YdbT with pleckstrin-like domain